MEAAVQTLSTQASNPQAAPTVRWFEECDKNSLPEVGGKCSSLGELIRMGVRVPPGFAVTTHGCTRFLREAGILPEIGKLLQGLPHDDIVRLEEASARIREMINRNQLETMPARTGGGH